MGIKHDRLWPIRQHDAIACVAIFLLCLSVRIVTAHYIEGGGDSVRKWYNVKQAVAGVPYDTLSGSCWDHHTSRWALMQPVYAVQCIFGNSPPVYYVFPIFMACAGAVVAYWLGRAAHSSLAGWFCALGTIAYPDMIRNGAQFTPYWLESVGVLSALLLLFLWQGNRKTRYLILSAAALFLGYGSKVTALYFLPGILIWLVFMQKDWRSAAVYLAVLAGLFAVETLAFYTLEGNPLGRLGILADSKHLHDAQNSRWAELSYVKDQSFFDWLLCWRDYLSFQDFAKYTIFASLLVCGAIVMLKKKPLYLLAFVYLSGFFFNTYTIVSVDPLLPPQPHLQPYLLPLAVVGFLTCIIFFVSLSGRTTESQAENLSPGHCRMFFHAKTIGVVIVTLMLCYYARHSVGIYRSEKYRGSLFDVIAEYSCVSEALHNGEPFALLTYPRTLEWCMLRFWCLYGDETKTMDELCRIAPEEIYPGEQGDLYVFNGKLSENVPAATARGTGFRRRHPIVLKLLEEKVASRAVEGKTAGGRLTF